MPMYPTRKTVHLRGVFLSANVFYKVRRGNANVESTMAGVDKEKRARYNRMWRKTLMISVTTPSHCRYWWMKEER